MLSVCTSHNIRQTRRLGRIPEKLSVCLPLERGKPAAVNKWKQKSKNKQGEGEGKGKEKREEGGRGEGEMGEGWGGGNETEDEQKKKFTTKALG